MDDAVVRELWERRALVTAQRQQLHPEIFVDVINLRAIIETVRQMTLPALLDS